MVLVYSFFLFKCNSLPYSFLSQATDIHFWKERLITTLNKSPFYCTADFCPQRLDKIFYGLVNLKKKCSKLSRLTLVCAMLKVMSDGDLMKILCKLIFMNEDMWMPGTYRNMLTEI